MMSGKVLAVFALLLALSSGARVKRVVGGAPAFPGEFPSLVSLWYLGDNNYYTANTSDRQHTCGGSLIDEQWVLTSAFCFDDDFLPGVGNLSSWIVVLGLHDQSDLGDAQVLDIEDIFILPEYNLTESYGDLALLRLSTPADLNSSDVDLAFYNSNMTCPVDWQMCTVVGWGQTSEAPFGNGSYVPNAAMVDIEPEADCAATYSSPDVTSLMGPVRIDAGSLCAGVHPHGGSDACNGDAGSPLICECDGDSVVVGTVVSGFGCARPGYSGIYTNVAFFSDWIDQTISQP